MIPVAATASQNAATAEQALSTRQLALGIAEIDASARTLRDQAALLEGFLEKFIVKEDNEILDASRSFALAGNV